MDEQKAKMPNGIPYLVGNEAVERYTYYAMRTVLIVFMTKYLVDSSGNGMSEEDAKSTFHLFLSANYFFPIMGSILADLLIGKYLTVITLSLVYTAGCAVLALVQTKTGLYLGLGLIALGSGGIKPCMMAMVGDQFSKKNKDLLGKAVRYFYLSIQVGGLVSTFVSPIVLKAYGPKVAFGIPAVLMGLATFIFWVGRNKYVRVPPNFQKFKAEVFNREGAAVIGRISLLLLFMTAFFSLYDQGGGALVLQASKMDLEIMFGWKILPSQVQIVNPLLCIVYVLLLDKYIYPLLDKVMNLTSLRKMGFGLSLMVPAFLITAWIQSRIDGGHTMSIWWQIGVWSIITMAEVLAYSTALEFFYTQAPASMKSLVQAFFMLSITLGNLFTSGVNWGIQNVSFLSGLKGASYYIFFASFMALTVVAFIIAAYYYKEKTYLQDAPEEAPS